MTGHPHPLARTEGLIIEELDDEILVYDEHRDHACSLNATAAAVWRGADGTRNVADLVVLLRDDVTDLADEDLVLLTLDELAGRGLIVSGYEPRDPDTSKMGRRRFIRRVGVVGAAALALPIVTSVVSPAVAAASTGNCNACSCPCGCTTCEPCGSCSASFCQPTGGCDCAPSCEPCGCECTCPCDASRRSSTFRPFR